MTVCTVRSSTQIKSNLPKWNVCGAENTDLHAQLYNCNEECITDQLRGSNWTEREACVHSESSQLQETDEITVGRDHAACAFQTPKTGMQKFSTPSVFSEDAEFNFEKKNPHILKAYFTLKSVASNPNLRVCRYYH